jgi:hypothetical protein
MFFIWVDVNGKIEIFPCLERFILPDQHKKWWLVRQVLRHRNEPRNLRFRMNIFKDWLTPRFSVEKEVTRNLMDLCERALP